MTEAKWLTWLAITVLFEAVLYWYIRSSEAKGAIYFSRWPLKSKLVMSRDDDPSKFDRVIRGWWIMMPIMPFIAFAVINFEIHR